MTDDSADSTDNDGDPTDKDAGLTDNTVETEVEPVMVVMSFRATEVDALMSVLARYVVVSRGRPSCRNIDFVASATSPRRVVVIEKWDSAAAQRAHFDSEEMVQMATACNGLLSEPPDIDLFESVSMHDLA